MPPKPKTPEAPPPDDKEVAETEAEPEPEPEPEVPLEDRPLLWRHFDLEALEKYYALASEPNEQARHLAETLGIEDWILSPQTARGAIKLDFCMYLLNFAKEAVLSMEQSSVLFSIGWQVLRVAMEGGSFAGAEGKYKELLLPLCTKKLVEGAAPYSLDDVKRITQFFTTSFFAHFKLYSFVYTQDQAHEARELHAAVELGKVMPLPGAYDEEGWAAYQAELEAARAAKEEEERLAKEAEEAARKAEEEERLAKEAEEARLREEEERKRIPQNLDDAVEFEVRKRLDALREELSAHYGSREEQLLEKIAALEGKLGDGK